MHSHKIRQHGFTIIELVVVIVIIGILAAVALPRFLGLQDKAHDAVVEGTQAALASGVLMANALWMSHAQETALDNLMDRTVQSVSVADGSCNPVVWGEANTAPENPEANRETVKVSLDANKNGYPVSHSIFGDDLSDGTLPGDVTPAGRDCGATDPAVDNNIYGATLHGGFTAAQMDQACQEVFEFLLSQQSVKSHPGPVNNFSQDFVEFIATAGRYTSEALADSAPETVARADSVCTYTYTKDYTPHTRYLEYNTETGAVTVHGLTTATYSAGN